LCFEDDDYINMLHRQKCVTNVLQVSVLNFLFADYLYMCHNYLEVCKLGNCSESLLVLNNFGDSLDSSTSVNLIVSPIKRFASAVCNELIFF